MSSSSETGTLYLILTDVVNSCDKDNDTCPIKWRKKVFYEQLNKLLIQDGSIALKSIGDALFVIIPNDNNKCIGTLMNVLEAFIACKISNFEIRAIIHKVCYGNGAKNKKGGDIATEISKIKNSNIKAKHLIDSLSYDIFGRQVNKASKLLSLLQGGAVLLSEDVVSDLINQPVNESTKIITEIYNNKIRSIEIKIEDNKLLYVIHSPVPITFLKGFDKLDKSDDDHISKEKPFIVWHLTAKKNIEEARLAIEYKERHSFRLLMTDLKTPQNILTKNADIQESVLLPLTKDKESFMFYTDFCWNVYDYYNFESIDFSRLKRKEFNKNIFRRYTKIFSGQSFSLEIKAQKNSFSTELIPKEGIKQDFILPMIVMDSYTQKMSSQTNRSIYQKNKEDIQQAVKVKIDRIEPQSIDIYEKISFNNNIDTNKLQSNYLLVFFRYFFDKLKDGDNSLQEIMSLDITDSDDELQIKPFIYGRLSGMVDAFALYEINSEKIVDLIENHIWKNAIEKYLKFNFEQKGYYNTECRDNFYSCSYITSLFLLNENKEFRKESKTLDYLILANK